MSNTYHKHKENILLLRSEGKSYSQIKAILGCSKGTISYHCGKDQKTKNLLRTYKRRNQYPLNTKREAFLTKRPERGILTNATSRILEIKHSGFHRNTKGKAMFTIEELKEKIGENPICYLTGRPIDITQGRTYHLDHIIPIAQGGDNSLENCQIACKEANFAKRDLMLDTFIKLCEEIVAYNQTKTL